MRAFLFVLCLLCTSLGFSQASPGAVLKISEVKSQPSGSVLIVRGTVTKYKAPTNDRAPHSVFIKDETGELRLPIWDDVFQKIEFREKLKSAGAVVTARVKTSEFRGDPEGRVQDPADIREGAVSLAPLTGLIWIEDLQAGMKQAAASGKDIFVFYSAENAENSNFLESKVLKDPRVIRAVGDKYVPVKIDIIKQPQLAQQLGIFRGGVFAMYHANGAPISTGPISTIRSVDDLLKALGAK